MDGDSEIELWLCRPSREESKLQSKGQDTHPTSTSDVALNETDLINLRFMTPIAPVLHKSAIKLFGQ